MNACESIQFAKCWQNATLGSTNPARPRVSIDICPYADNANYVLNSNTDALAMHRKLHAHTRKQHAASSKWDC